VNIRKNFQFVKGKISVFIFLMNPSKIGDKSKPLRVTNDMKIRADIGA